MGGEASGRSVARAYMGSNLQPDLNTFPWQTIAGYAYAPAPDQLWRNVPMPLGGRYDVLGVPLAVMSNAPVLAELAADSFGGWGPPATDRDALRLHLFLHQAPEGPRTAVRPAPVFRAQGDYFVLAVGGSLGFADRAAGFACAYLTPALLDDRLFAQVGFVECLGLYLTTRYRRATLHAAGLVEGDRGILLTGHNGAGKSTLAYAAVRAGMRLLAEDVVYLEESGQPLRAWGNPWHMHLLPDAVRFFPELASGTPTAQLNGETKLRLRTDAIHSRAPVTRTQVAGVLSLGRATGRDSRLRPADPDHVRRALTQFDQDMGPEDQAAMVAAAERLLAGPLAHLEVGTDLDAAVDMVRRWLAEAPRRVE